MHGFRAKALVFVLASVAAPFSGALLGTGAERPAHASVSIAVTFEGLLKETTAAAVVTPVEQMSVWENGRIYTYTRVHTDRVLAGQIGDEAWVRTMGGIVGKIGQAVDGEAVLTLSRPCLLFLHPGPPGALEVTARGQGQFPVVVNEKREVRLIKGSGSGALLPPKARAGALAQAAPLAADVIHGRLVDDVAKDVSAAWAKAHAK